MTAASIACRNNSTGSSEVVVQARGGKLRVKLNKEGNQFNNIWLIGTGEFVYEGEIDV